MNKKFGPWLLAVIFLSAPLHGWAQANAAGGAEASSFSLFAVGFDALKGTNAGTTLRDIVALPETKLLESSIWDRIAPALDGRFVPKTSPGGGNAAALIRPLLDELLNGSSYLEIRRDARGAFEWLVATRLSEARVRIWRDAAGRLADGWRVKSAAGTNVLLLISTNSWCALAALSDSPGAVADWMGRFPNARAVLERGRPAEFAPGSWLRAEGDLSLILPDIWTAAGTAPNVTLTVVGKGETLRTEARLQFRNPVNWNLEAWRIPTNSIHDPNGSLMSFTAVRGFRPLIADWPWVKALGWGEIPNQLFAWADTHSQFQIFAAVPLRGAGNWLRQFVGAPMTAFKTNFSLNGAGEILFRPDDARLIWGGLPLVVPYVLPAGQAANESLVAGVFPLNEPASNPAPAELFQQLTTKTNLLYYDWEITEARLGQLRPLTQLLSLIFAYPQVEPESPMFHWLDAATPKLGNTLTEIAVVSPRDLQLVRTSHIGLNGAELLALAHWLQTPQFPALPRSIGLRPAPSSPAALVPAPGF